MGAYPKVLSLYPLKTYLLDQDDPIDANTLSAIEKAKHSCGGNALILDGPNRGYFHSLTPEDIKAGEVTIIIVHRTPNYLPTPDIFHVKEERLIYNILVDPETKTMFLSGILEQAKKRMEQ